jgi:predicted nucleotidyltransferase
MISDSDKNVIVRIARKYNVRRVLLFGSSRKNPDTARDIDIAVDGVDASIFFDFYRDLIFDLSKPVDVVDLSENTRFTRMVAETGILIYG